MFDLYTKKGIFMYFSLFIFRTLSGGFSLSFSWKNVPQIIEKSLSLDRLACVDHTIESKSLLLVLEYIHASC